MNFISSTTCFYPAAAGREKVREKERERDTGRRTVIYLCLWRKTSSRLPLYQLRGFGYVNEIRGHPINLWTIRSVLCFVIALNLWIFQPLGRQWLERFDDPDRWWTLVQRHWWGPLSRMLAGRTGDFTLFQHIRCFALWCGFGGGVSDVIAKYDAATVLVTVTWSGAASFTPRDWYQSIRSLPVTVMSNKKQCALAD